MSVADFIPSIKGIFIAITGWIVASVHSFGFLFQSFAASRVELYDAWISLAIKAVTFIGAVIIMYYNINKVIKQRRTMRPDGGGDNESGQGSDIDPREDNGND